MPPAGSLPCSLFGDTKRPRFPAEPNSLTNPEAYLPRGLPYSSSARLCSTRGGILLRIRDGTPDVRREKRRGFRLIASGDDDA
jgi:hypothetical protein